MVKKTTKVLEPKYPQVSASKGCGTFWNWTERYGHVLLGVEECSPADLPQPEGVIWLGPYVEGIRGSSLGRFLDCRDRFLHFIRGWQSEPTFEPRMFAGNLWHKAMDGDYATHTNRMRDYFMEVIEEQTLHKTEITDMARLVRRFYHIFHEYVGNTDIEATEFKFCLAPFAESHGLQVKVKGTMDGITKISPEGYIREIKVRGKPDIYETDRLGFSKQTMLYHSCFRKIHGYKAEGTEYHHIQRPLSNRDCPRKTKKITKQEFHDKVVRQCEENPERFFHITKRPISDAEIDEFEETFLLPILSYLGWWWTCLCHKKLEMAFHWRTPWGLYSKLQHWEPDEFDTYYMGDAPLIFNSSLTSKDI